MNKLTTAIVGDGRLATHLVHYFDLMNQNLIQWSRKKDILSPEEALKDCSLIILALSDRAILPFVQEHPSLKEKILIHCSGSLTLEGIMGYHPLMAFGETLYTLETYQSIPFVSEKGNPPLKEIFPFLTNRENIIDPSQKSLYHALCVSAGNFPALILAQVKESLGAIDGLEWEAFAAYLTQNLANSLENPQAALTGPIVRGDRDTMERNLNSLEGNGLKQVYLAVQNMYEESQGGTHDS